MGHLWPEPWIQPKPRLFHSPRHALSTVRWGGGLGSSSFISPNGPNVSVPGFHRAQRPPSPQAPVVLQRGIYNVMQSGTELSVKTQHCPWALHLQGGQ